MQADDIINSNIVFIYKYVSYKKSMFHGSNCMISERSYKEHVHTPSAWKSGRQANNNNNNVELSTSEIQ